MQESELKVVIVGGGAMATEFHLPRVLTLMKASRVDLIESNPVRRCELSARYSKDSRVRILAEVPGGSDYQLGIVAVPPAFHADVVARCAPCCAQLLVEKPLCLNVAQGRQLVEHCEANRAQAFVCLPRRALQHLTILKSFRESGVHGQLQKVVVNEGRPFGWKAASYAYFLKQQSGGGVLMDLGPHVLDQLLQVFGRLRLSECKLDCQPGAIEANCSLSLKGDDEIPLMVWLSRNRYLSNTMVFYFARASCTAALHREEIVVRPTSGTPYLIGPLGEPVGFERALDRIYLEGLLRGDNRGISPAESLTHLALIEDAYASAGSFEAEDWF